MCLRVLLLRLRRCSLLRPQALPGRRGRALRLGAAVRAPSAGSAKHSHFCLQEIDPLEGPLQRHKIAHASLVKAEGTGTTAF